MRIIKLEEYDQRWPKYFEKEVDAIKILISENLLSAHHIGSTAILGMKAKPVIDIMLVVKSLSRIDKINQKFVALGYEVKGEYGIQGRRFFQKGKNKRTHHIHIFEQGNSEIERHILFVDFMNAHPNWVAEYEHLKIALSNRYKNEPQKYSQGKADFLQAIDLEAVKWKKASRVSLLDQ